MAEEDYSHKQQQPRLRKNHRRLQQQNQQHSKQQFLHRTKYDITDKHHIENSDEEQDEILPKWKLFLVGAAIFMCFALLYPSVFSPMLGSLSGNRHDQTENNRDIHPSMLGGRQREHRPGRPIHPHPAAASLQQSQQSTGASRGGFSWLLPFYTIGVVFFLLYTLFKIMFKKKAKQKTKGFERYINDDEDMDESDHNIGYGAGGYKSHIVNARLRKTEKAMQEILQQLELIAAQTQHKEPNLTQHEDLNANISQIVSEDGVEYISRFEHNIQPEKEENIFPTNFNEGMTAEQQIEMQKSLDKLRILSEMCKREQGLKHIVQPSRRYSTEDDDDQSLDYEEEEELTDNEENEEFANELNFTEY